MARLLTESVRRYVEALAPPVTLSSKASTRCSRLFGVHVPDYLVFCALDHADRPASSALIGPLRS